MTNKQALKLSAIVDKMDIQIKNPKAGQEEVGAELMLQLVRKAYKAETELLQFIADIKCCSVEEASALDFVATVKELLQDQNLLGFFKSAVRSSIQG